MNYPLTLKPTLKGHLLILPRLVQKTLSIPLSVTLWSVPISRVLFGLTWPSRVLVVLWQPPVRRAPIFPVVVIIVACPVPLLQAIR